MDTLTVKHRAYVTPQEMQSDGLADTLTERTPQVQVVTGHSARASSKPRDHRVWTSSLDEPHVRGGCSTWVQQDSFIRFWCK
jgi:hypothetical protein